MLIENILKHLSFLPYFFCDRKCMKGACIIFFWYSNKNKTMVIIKRNYQILKSSLIINIFFNVLYKKILFSDIVLTSCLWSVSSLKILKSYWLIMFMLFLIFYFQYSLEFVIHVWIYDDSHTCIAQLGTKDFVDFLIL